MRQGISINLLKQFFFIYNFIMNKRKESLPLLRGDFYIFLSHKANNNEKQLRFRNCRRLFFNSVEIPDNFIYVFHITETIGVIF